MGVLQWGRDREVADRATSAPRLLRSLWLQWGRDREVADSERQRELDVIAAALQWGRDREVADSGPTARDGRALHGFNGAATARSRIGCGSWPLPSRWALLQWGRDREVADSILIVDRLNIICRCFNGAATARSRIGISARWSRPSNARLQWGRDREVADRRDSVANIRQIRKASMGPRPRGRG